MKKKLILGAIVILVIIIIASLVNRSKNSGTTAKIERGSVERNLILSGEVISKDYAKLSFETSGNISYIGVSEGAYVKKGQLIASLETLEANSDYERSKSDLRLAAATKERVYDSLKGKGNAETFIEKETRTEAEVAYDKAYEAVKKAERNLRDSKIVAPFDGFVSNIAYTSIGNYIAVATPFAQIYNPGSLYFKVFADQTDVLELSKDKKVEIILDVKDQKIDGVIKSISLLPNLSATDTEYEVQVEANMSQFDWVRIGMSGDMNVNLETKESVLFVDPTFVKEEDDKSYLLIGPNKKKVYIKQGLVGESAVEIISDEIKEEDIVHD